MKHIPTLSALFSFPRFRPGNRLQGIFGDPQGRLVTEEYLRFKILAAFLPRK